MPDLAYRDGWRMLHIVDWKTGGEHTEEIQLQLACYALYAMHRWQAKIEELSLEGVFLNDGGLRKVYQLSAEQLVGAKEHILKSAATMRNLLSDPVQNLAAEGSFACSPRHCPSCSFRRLCPKNNDETATELPIEEFLAPEPR